MQRRWNEPPDYASADEVTKEIQGEEANKVHADCGDAHAQANDEDGGGDGDGTKGLT